MEEEKAVAYYDELTRKGGGAARFKQGLGFSSSENDAVPVKRTPSSSSSFLSSFVRASSPTTTSNLEKQSQLESIQNKLKKKPSEGRQTESRVSKDSERDRRDRERDHRDRDRDRDRDRGRDHRDRDRDSERRRRRRSVSPRRERRDGKRREVEKERKSKVDYSRLIEGYDGMVCLDSDS